MGYFDLEYLGLIPAFLILLVGLLLRRGKDAQKSEQHFLLFLLVAGSVLVGLMGLFQLPAWQSSRLRFQDARILTLPLVGVLALTVLYLPRLRGMERKMKTAVFILAALQLALIIALSTSRDFGFWLLHLPAVAVVVIFWALGRHYNGLAVTFGLLALGGILFLNYLITHPQDGAMQLAGLILILATPLLGVAAPAILIANGLHRWADSGAASRRGLFMSLALALLTLVLVSLYVFWASVWDQTMDLGFGFLVVPFVTGTAVAAGMAMSVVLEGKQRLVGLAFMLLLPLLFYQLHALGLNAPYHTYNEERADRIAAALDDFYEREGHYPQTLASLVPRDLLSVPPPILLHGEQWCYQGGPNFYRLTAFYQPHWASLISLKIYASRGELPSGEWVCETMLTEVKDRHYEGVWESGTSAPPSP